MTTDPLSGYGSPASDSITSEQVNRFDSGRKKKLREPESGWHEGEEDISNQYKQDPKRHALLPVWCRQRGPVVEEEEAEGY